MEQIYQIMWVLLIVSVSLNAVTYYVAPSYICPDGVCPQELLQTATTNVYNLDETRESLTSTQSGAVSGTIPSTPTGFWETLAGTVVGSQAQEGLIKTVLVPVVSFVIPVQTLSLYYANQLDVPILKNMVLVFVTIFTIIQLIGITFFIIYLAGLVRGVRA